MKRTKSDSAASTVKTMLNAAKEESQVHKHLTLRDGDQTFGRCRARARKMGGLRRMQGYLDLYLL